MWIVLLSKGSPFEDNVSLILSPIVVTVACDQTPPTPFPSEKKRFFPEGRGAFCTRALVAATMICDLMSNLILTCLNFIIQLNLFM